MAITGVKILVRYKHYDVLQNRFRDVDDCTADSIAMFKTNLLKYPGLAGSVGYGKRIRVDLMAWIVLTWSDSGASITKEFPDAKMFAGYLKSNPELARALQFHTQ